MKNTKIKTCKTQRLKFHTFKKLFFVFNIFVLLALCNGRVFSQPWTFDFGTGTGAYNTSSGAITNFYSTICSPTVTTPVGGGTYRVRISNGQGGSLMNPNPGTSLGSGSEMQLTASATASTTKNGIYDWTSPSTVAYLKAKLRTTSSGNGNLAIAIGINTIANDANGYTGHYNNSLVNFKITYATGAISTVTRRTSGVDNAIASHGFTKDADQYIEIYCNNNAASQDYVRSGTTYTLATKTWDLWVDGTRTVTGAATAGTLAAGTNISGIGFFAESSTSNVAVMYIDDIEYSNALPACVAPATQASGITFSNVTSSGIQIDWSNGDGSSRVVFVKETSGTITNPVDGTTYTASTDWSAKGTQLGTSGYYCVYNGTGTTVTLSNLASNTAYYVQVFDYNCSGTASKYQTATATNNPNNQTTLSAGNVIVAGSTGANGSYSTLKAAFDAINSNADQTSNNITISIAADITETATASLSQPATATWTSLKIYPTGATRTISGNIVSALIALDGADAVTIDGRLGGTGTANSLIIENTSTDAGASSVKYVNDATNNVLRDAIVKGSGTSSGIIYLASTTQTTGNDNNSFLYSTFQKSGTNLPTIGILSAGTSSKTNSTITIDNCNFVDIKNESINLLSNSTDFTITNNNFYQSGSITTTANHYFIYIGTGGNYTVSSNNFGGTSSGCGGTAYYLTTSGTATFRAIEFTGTITGTNTLNNNKIANINFTTTTTSAGTIFGCFLVDGTGTFNIGSTGNGNTIGATTGIGSITITDNGTGTGRSFVGFNSLGTGTRAFSYNSMGAISISGTNTASNIALTRVADNGYNTISYNTIGNATSNNISSSLGAHFYGIFTSSTHASGTIIQNNTYQNINISSIATKIFSLCWSNTSSTVINFSINTLNNIYTSLAGVASLFYNLGSSSTNTFSSNTISNLNFASAGSASSYWLYHVGTSLTVENNNLSLFSLSNSSNTGDFTGFYNSTAVSNTSNINNNIFGSASANNMTIVNNNTCTVINNNGSGTTNVNTNTIRNWNLTNTGSSASFAAISNGAGILNANGNTISDINSVSTSTAATTIMGIIASANTSGNIVKSNSITNLNCLTTTASAVSVTGIKVSGTGSAGNCEANFVSGLTNQATAATVGTNITGLDFNLTPSWNVFNNIILLSNGAYTNDVDINGISVFSSSTINFYHNTIKISGSAAGSANLETYGIFDIDAGTGTRTYKNNICQNIRTGGSATNYNYAYLVNTATGATFNYNYGEVSKDANYFGSWATVSYNFANWKTNSGAANDLNGTTTIDATGKPDAAFVGANVGLDLFTPSTVTTDYNGDARDANPWMGAYEVGSLITLANNGTQIAAANVSAGTTNHILHKFSLAVANANTTFTGLTVTTAGTYVSADITNIKVWYSTDNTFSSGTDVLLETITTPGIAGDKAFSSFSQAISAGSTGYIFITTDVASDAVNVHNINVNAVTTAQLTFLTGSKSGSTANGGVQTIVSPAITLASANPAVADANLAKNSTKNPIYKFTTAVANAATTLNSVSFTTTNTDAADVTKYQLWFKTSDVFSTATQIGSDITTSLGTGTHTFSGLTQVISSGAIGYFWIATDISAGSTINNTIIVSVLTTSDLTFVTGTKTGTASVGGTQTIVAASVACATDLIISEYVHGSASNKYIELYNGTNSSVNLADYELRLYANGASTPTATLTLTGTLTVGSTIVYKNSAATLYGGTATSANTICAYNGDDAIALLRTSAPAGFIDIFGNIGCDPGTDWTNINTTLSKSLVRNALINVGVSVDNGTSCPFPTLGTDWTQYNVDDVSHLGAHSMSCDPTLFTSVSTLTGFTYPFGSGPSASQSYNLSGINLTGFPSNITVTAPTDYEVSLSSGSGYATSVNVAYTSSVLASTAIYVRLKAGIAMGSYNSELVANAGGGATTVNVTCNGTVAAATPVITLTGTLTAFSNSCISVATAEKTYSVSGANLTSDITITPPTNFEISTTSGSGFVVYPATLILSQSGGSVATTTIYVRMNPVASGALSGNISHTSTSATTQSEACSGTGLALPAITGEPINASAMQDGSVSFTVVATGASLTYQWQVSTNGGSSFSDLSEAGIYIGTTTNDLWLITIPIGYNAYQYRCIVSGGCSPSVTSNACMLNVLNYAVGDYRPKNSYANFSFNNTAGLTNNWEYFDGTSWGVTLGDKAPQNATTTPTRVIIDKIGVEAGGNASNSYNDIVIVGGGELILNEWGYKGPSGSPLISADFIKAGKSLEVKSGGILVVQGNFRPTATSNLIVRSGGTLIINESRLTNDEAMWNGIENFEAGSYVEYQNWDWSAGAASASLVNVTATITNNSNGYKFGYLRFNGAPTSDWTIIGGPIGVINLCFNDFVIDNSGANYIAGASNKDSGPNGFVVNGNLIVNSGNFNFGTSHSTDPFSQQFTINGNFEFNGSGTLKTHRNGGAVASVLTGYVNFLGNVAIASTATFSNDVADNSGTKTKMYININGPGTYANPQLINIGCVNTGTSINIDNSTFAKLKSNNLRMNGIASTATIFTVKTGSSFHFGWADDGVTPLIVTSNATGTNSFFTQGTTSLFITHPGGLDVSSATAGNIQQFATRTINQAATFRYVGVVNQVTGSAITNTTGVKNIIVDLLNSSNTLSLSNAITTTGKLALHNGIVVTTGTNILTIGNGGSVHSNIAMTDGIAGSATSFVDGPVAKIGTTAFTFPTGNGTTWARIAIGTPSASETFTAQYFHSGYGNGIISSTTPVILDHVSSLEYWNLSRAGAQTATVTLFSENALISLIDNCTDLKIAHWCSSCNSGAGGWENNNDASTATFGGCAVPISPTTQSGSIITSAAVTSFSPFTFGSKTSKNPLPISLLYFDAKYNNENVDLKWETASEINNAYFILQRSSNGSDFKEIGMVNGAGNSNAINNYLYTDQSPDQGINYYRLKQIDYDGNFKYSDVVAVNFTSYSDKSDYIFYNKDIPEIKVLVAKSFLKIKITNTLGQILFSKSYHNINENDVLKISPVILKNEIYLIKITDAERNEIIKFLH